MSTQPGWLQFHSTFVLKQKWSKNSRLRKNKLKIESQGWNEKVQAFEYGQTVVRLTSYKFIRALDHCFHSPAEKISLKLNITLPFTLLPFLSIFLTHIFPMAGLQMLLLKGKEWLREK